MSDMEKGTCRPKQENGGLGVETHEKSQDNLRKVRLAWTCEMDQ